MSRLHILIVFGLLNVYNCVAQAPVIQWQKCLGGSHYDAAVSIQQTTDGGYIVAGVTSSNDGDVSGNHGSLIDFWVVKLTATGSIQWQKCLGGTNDDEAYSIQQTTDGGYIVAGSTNSYNGDVSGYHGAYDAWIVKLTATGSLQWQKCLGGSNNDAAYSIRQTTDGGYIVAGYTSSTNGDISGNHGGDDAWVVKLTATGSVQWQKCLGGSNTDAIYSIQQTIDGGYIVAGVTGSSDGDVSGFHGVYDCWVVKLNATGDIQWQKCLGGSDDDAAYSIRQTTDGRYIIAGWTASTDEDASGNHGYLDYWIVKLSDVKAELKWDKSFAEQTSAPKGVAADGVARVYLKVNKADSSSTSTDFQNVVVSLKDSFNTTGTAMLGKVQPATTLATYSTEANAANSTTASSAAVQNGSIWFWYVAPDDFSNATGSIFANASEREVQAHIVVTYTDGTIDSTDLPIKIVRPPLMLVHGIAANEDTWKNFKYDNGNLFTASPLFKQKKAVNLFPHASYETNANLLLSPDGTGYTISSNRLNTLQGNIEALRKQGYACNQVDYVCHSMGGCVLRTAVNFFPNKFYGLDGSPYKNYGKGFVHKAITINTPHQGSPVADAVTEYIPQASFYINRAFGVIYNYFPNAPMIFDFIEPVDAAQPYGPWKSTPAVQNLQVSAATGGVDLASTNINNHLIAGDVNIYSAQTAVFLADLDKYVELMDQILKVSRAVAPSGPLKRYLTSLLVLEKTVRVFTFIEWYSQQKGFPNFLGDGDLIVPLASQLAGQSISSFNTSLFYNSSNGFLDVNHLTIKDRMDVGNRVKELLNSAVGSHLFGPSIPARLPSAGGRLSTPGFNQQQANLMATNNYDTTKIKITAPTPNSTLPADSTRTIQVNLKDTVDLAYIDVIFQGKSLVSVSRDATQSFIIKIDSAFLGTQSISATAVYDRANSTDYYTDTITANVITNAVLTGFTAKADTNYIYKGQPFFPFYTAIYTNYNAGIPPNNPDLNVSIANTTLVQYNAVQHAFYAIADTGTTKAIITYKTFKDTIAFVLLPNLYSGCINRTTDNTTLRNAANWSRSAIPATCDSVVVMPGHTLVIDSSMQIRSLYISVGATVSLADSTVRLQIGEADDGDKSFVNNGNLIINNGKIAVNGGLKLMAGSNFTMTGGELILDANTGYTETSLPNAKNIFDVSGTMNSFSFTGGTLQIIDPPLWNSCQSINCPYDFGDNTTTKFGNGISTTASNNLNGFGGNLLPAKIGKLVLDAATPNSNRIFANLNPLTVKSSVQVKSGNLVQKAPIQVVQ